MLGVLNALAQNTFLPFLIKHIPAVSDQACFVEDSIVPSLLLFILLLLLLLLLLSLNH